MSTLSWTDLRLFATMCTGVSVQVPAAIARGLELIAIAERANHVPRRSLLELTDEELRERIVELSIHEHDRDGKATQRGLRPGILAVTSALVDEVHAAVMPELEEIIEQLRPQFAELVAPLERAAQEFDFTYRTTSDDVIRRDDPRAVDAWRVLPDAWASIAPIVSLRVKMAQLFESLPTTNEARVLGALPNTSVCFAAGDNWSSTKGYYLDAKTVGHLDWLDLAVGGLRLNSPAEVLAKRAARGYTEPDPSDERYTPSLAMPTYTP